MTHYYSDPAREHDTYALPDVEVFYVNKHERCQCSECGHTWEPSVTSIHKTSCTCIFCQKTRLGRMTCERCDRVGDYQDEGFYYWFCFPGCLPEGEPWGPYKTEEEAIEACRKEHGEYDCIHDQLVPRGDQ